MQKKHPKKLIAVLLAFLMISSCVPAPLYANDDLSGLNAAKDDVLWPDQAQAALQGLREYKNLSGLYGFTENDVDLTSENQIPVIALLNHMPAAVAQAMADGPAQSGAASLSAMARSAAEDKALFYAGLDEMLIDYAVTFDYETTINGAALRLPANKVGDLLNISSVAAVFYDETFIAQSAVDSGAALAGGSVSGALNKVSAIAMGIPQAHARGYKGKNVVIGIMDNGVDYYHPDLKARFHWFKTMYEVPERWRDRVYEVPVNGNEVEPYNQDNIYGSFPTDGLEGYSYVYYGVNTYDWQFAPYSMVPHSFPMAAREPFDPMDTSWYDLYFSGYPGSVSANPGGTAFYDAHGTMTSGTAVADGSGSTRSSDGEKRSSIGVAPEAKLIHYRIAGPNGRANNAATIKAIEESILDGCDIVSYSFGITFDPYAYGPLALAVNASTYVYNVVFCHAAANSGPESYSIGGPDTPLALTSGNNQYYGLNVVLQTGDRTHNASLTHSDWATEIYPILDSEGKQVEKWSMYGGPNFTGETKNAAEEFSFYVMPARPNTGFNNIGTGAEEDWTRAEVADAVKGKFVVVARAAADEVVTDITVRAKSHGAAGLMVINTANGEDISNWGTSTNYTIDGINGNNTNMNVPTLTMVNADGLAFVEALRANSGKALFLDLNGKGRGLIVSSSSRGPIPSSFEIKPDVVTPGQGTITLSPWWHGIRSEVTQANFDLAMSLDRGQDNYFQRGYRSGGGTSNASPFTAGLAALIIGADLDEYYSAHPDVKPWEGGNGPNPHRMNAIEVKARLANTADSEWWADKNLSVYEIGAGSPHVIEAIEAEAFITVTRENVPIPVHDLFELHFERLWKPVTSEVSSFSFGSGSVGAALKKTLNANVYNTGSEEKTFDITYEWNTGMNNPTQNVKSNGNVLLTLDKKSVTVAAGGKGNFSAAVEVPASLTENDQGSHEGYITLSNTVDKNESYHLPFAIVITPAIPQWYQNGQETGDGVYCIRTGEELDQLSKIVSGTYGFQDSFEGKTIVQMDDLDIGYYNTGNTEIKGATFYPMGWNSIGTFENPFKGTYDGNGFEIRNLSTTEVYTNPVLPNYRGLFGHVVNAALKNITIASGRYRTKAAEGPIGTSDIRTGHYGAAVVAMVTTTDGGNSLIENCVNMEDVTASGLRVWKMHVGGIVGFAETREGGTLTVKDCVNYGDISGATFIGGILGGTAVSERAIGNLEYAPGAIYGNIEGDLVIEDCVNYGDIHLIIDLARGGGISGYLASDGDGSAKVISSGNHGKVYLNNPLSVWPGSPNLEVPASELYTYYPGYGNYSPERLLMNSIGGVIGHAKGAEVVGSYNFGAVINNPPTLMEMDGVEPLAEGEQVELRSGGILGFGEGVVLSNNMNAGDITVNPAGTGLPTRAEPAVPVSSVTGGIAAVLDEESSADTNINLADIQDDAVRGTLRRIWLRR